MPTSGECEVNSICDWTIARVVLVHRNWHSYTRYAVCINDAIDRPYRHLAGAQIIVANVLCDPIEAKIEECLVYEGMDLKVSGTLTRHIHHFDIPVPQSTLSDRLHPDKEQLRADIPDTRASGMSYRKIGVMLGIHWTRVEQIVKNAD
jgi:hypothetical protein